MLNKLKKIFGPKKSRLLTRKEVIASAKESWKKYPIGPQPGSYYFFSGYDIDVFTSSEFEKPVMDNGKFNEFKKLGNINRVSFKKLPDGTMGGSIEVFIMNDMQEILAFLETTCRLLLAGKKDNDIICLADQIVVFNDYYEWSPSTEGLPVLCVDVGFVTLKDKLPELYKKAEK